MNAVVQKSEGQVQRMDAPAISESAAIIQVIERAAMNPNVDIDKMERLLEMQERIVARNSKVAFAAAFATMQEHLPAIKERGIGHNKAKYALWEDVNDAIKPVLTAHGFGISFRTGRAGDMLTITAILSHRDGHSEETTLQLPADTSGNKVAVQAIGSTMSYGKRYAAAAILNLTSRDGMERDDDGAGSSGNGEAITDEQATKIMDLIIETNSNMPIFLKFFGVARIDDIPATRFAEVISKLNAKKDQQSKAAAQ